MTATATITPLRKIQLGEESPAGTLATPDILWRGTGGFEDNRKIVNLNENIGIHVPFDTTVLVQSGATWTLEQDLTAEQFMTILTAGYSLGNVASDGGGGSGKIWTALMPHTASAAVPTATYTIRQILNNGGGGLIYDEGAFGHVSEYNIKGTPGDVLKLSSTWQTRGIASTETPATIAVPTVHPIPFGGGQLYVDAIALPIGTTPQSNSLVGFDLKVKTGLVPAYTVDRLDFSIVKYTKPEVTLDVTYESTENAQGTQRQTIYWGQTARKLRLKFVGAALTTPGTSYTYYTLIIDIIGKWTSFKPVDTMDGNDVVTGTFTGMYNATADAYHSIILVNEQATRL